MKWAILNYRLARTGQHSMSGKAFIAAAVWGLPQKWPSYGCRSFQLSRSSIRFSNFFTSRSSWSSRSRDSRSACAISMAYTVDLMIYQHAGVEASQKIVNTLGHRMGEARDDALSQTLMAHRVLPVSLIFHFAKWS